MWRYLEKDEEIKEGDELLPGGIHFLFTPIIKFGQKCGRFVVRRKVKTISELFEEWRETVKPDLKECSGASLFVQWTLLKKYC